MRKISSLCMAIMALTFSSCQQEDFTNNSTTESAACNIGFAQIKDFTKLGTRSVEDSEIIPNVDTNIGIKARIARKSKNCKSGFGLCDFRAMTSYDNAVRFQTRSTSNENKRECFTKCVIDDSGNGIAYFLLSDSPESQGLTSGTMPPFYVDEEIEQPIEETPEYSLFAIQGAYLFQSNLGEYGGYAVKMKYKE